MAIINFNHFIHQFYMLKNYLLSVLKIVNNFTTKKIKQQESIFQCIMFSMAKEFLL